MTTRAVAPAIDEKAVRSIAQRRDEPAWLQKRRLDAWRAFEAMAMPNPLGEEWRRTDVSGLDLAAALESGAASGKARLPRDLRDRRSLAGLLVQQDDDVVEHFLGSEAAQGLIFSDLHTAAQRRPDLVEQHLHSLVGPTEWKLLALEAALWQGGALIYVPRGVEVTLPLRYAAWAGGRSLFPHLLIVAEENSSLTVVQETRSSDGAGQALISGAVEIVAGPYARVRFLDLQRGGKRAYSFSTIRARLDRGAELTAGLVGLGSRLNKTRLDVALEGEGARTELLGLSFSEGSQHFDYTTLQDHIGPKTESDLLFKAALADQSSEVWNGTVRIQKGGSGSTANQTSRNLLLSDQAKAAPIPVLEIEAYDILRCSHGATAGPLDEDQRFYLESRGIAPADAQRLLVEAFFKEVVDRLPAPHIHPAIEKALRRRIEGKVQP